MISQQKSLQRKLYELSLRACTVIVCFWRQSKHDKYFQLSREEGMTHLRNGNHRRVIRHSPLVPLGAGWGCYTVNFLWPDKGEAVQELNKSGLSTRSPQHCGGGRHARTSREGGIGKVPFTVAIHSCMYACMHSFIH